MEREETCLSVMGVSDACCSPPESQIETAAAPAAAPAEAPELTVPVGALVHCVDDGKDVFSDPLCLEGATGITIQVDVFNSPIPGTNMYVGIVCIDKLGDIISPWQVHRDCSVQLVGIDFEKRVLHLSGTKEAMDKIAQLQNAEAHRKTLAFQHKSKAGTLPGRGSILEGFSFRGGEVTSFSVTYDTNTHNSTYHNFEVDSCGDAANATGHMYLNPGPWKQLCSRILPELMKCPDEPIVMSLSHSSGTYTYVHHASAAMSSFTAISAARTVCSEEDWAAGRYDERVHLRPGTAAVKAVFLQNNYGGSPDTRPTGTAMPYFWRNLKITRSLECGNQE